jgi:flagellar hook-basal body complex protein FliE
MPIDPSFLTSGGEWSISGAGSPGGGASGIGGADGTDGGTPVGGADRPSFGGVLADQISSLEKQQVTAAEAARALADGTATDPSTAIVAVERARLSMQLASQLRTKGVEAMNDIFHTQV